MTFTARRRRQKRSLLHACQLPFALPTLGVNVFIRSLRRNSMNRSFSLTDPVQEVLKSRKVNLHTFRLGCLGRHYFIQTYLLKSLLGEISLGVSSLACVLMLHSQDFQLTLQMNY
eukprot:6201570-Pleurochrysis_carterae.AAC.3